MGLEVDIKIKFYENTFDDLELNDLFKLQKMLGFAIERKLKSGEK